MKFFRELYEGGDEDTRRAMVKSMQESGGRGCPAKARVCLPACLPARLSAPLPTTLLPLPGGTALSMNWTDVGKKDYSKTGAGVWDTWPPAAAAASVAPPWPESLGLQIATWHFTLFLVSLCADKGDEENEDWGRRRR